MQQVRVTAVVVAHNGGQYLSRTLDSLAGQTRPADFVVGVNVGSTDHSEALLTEHLIGPHAAVASGHKTGFGSAVALGLAEKDGSRSRRNDRLAAKLPAGSVNNSGGSVALADPPDEPVGGAEEWLWLLHDDSAPAPDALAELLAAVERAPAVTVAGCKQLEWDHPRRLIDVGLSTSGWAERLSLIDVDELDQGQYDGRSDVFAVNSAGMLVRRDVWDALGGFDRALPGAGDDVDFCWRNRLAGHRVVVVPSARMQHVVRRPHDMGSPSIARRAEVYLRLKHAPLWKVPFLAAGALLGSIIRFVLSVIAKDPAYGAGQLVATLAALLRPFTLFKGRRRAARTRRVSRTVIRGLQTPRREVWSHRRSRLEAFDAQYIVGDGDGGDDGDGQGLQSPTGGSDDFVSLAAPARRWSGTGAIAAALILTAVSFFGLHWLFGAQAIAGGSLLPLSPTMTAIWQNASSWWVGLGAGFAGHGDPFDYILWLLAAVGFGNGSAAVLWLTLLALPLAGLGAWTAAGALTQRPLVRFWAALVWAGVPALQIALGSGRLGALLAHLLIPWVVLGMLRAVGAAAKRPPGAASGISRQSDSVGTPGTNGRPSWTAAAAAGLVLAALTASAPTLLPLAMLVVIALSIGLRRRAKTLWWSLLPSLALFAPFAVSALSHPRALLADPGQPLPFEDALLWQKFLGYPVRLDPEAGLHAFPELSTLLPGPWTLIAALVIGAPLVLLAAVSLFTTGNRSNLARVLWLVALLAAGGAFICTRIAVSGRSEVLIPPFTGPLVSLLVFMMLGAAVLGANRMLEVRRAGDGRIRRLPRVIAAAAAGVLLLGPVASLALWAIPTAGVSVASAETHIRPAAPRTLPATATDRAYGPEQTRTLVLNVDGTGKVSAALMRGGGTTMDALSTLVPARPVVGGPGEETAAAPDPAEQMLRKAAAIIAAGAGVDPRPELEQLGAGFVVLQQSDTAAELLSSHIDTVPGLTSVGETDSGWLWRVRPLATADDEQRAAEATSRVRIVDGEGRTVAGVPSDGNEVSAEISDGGADRLVVLAERKNPHWSAWLDGERLTATADDWAQAFALPADGGSLQIKYSHPWTAWWATGQIVVIGLTVLLAVPLPAKRRNTIRRRVGSEADRPEARTG
ncbi:glycosyltransferase family 2 protein [Arthrobacter monumenti]